MVTRLYLPASGTSPLPLLAVNTNWELVNGLVRLPCFTAKQGTLLATTQMTWPATSTQQWCWWQYQSQYLQAAYSWTTTDTVSMVIGKCAETTTSGDTHLAYIVRVVSGDGTVIRGVIGLYHATSTEYPLMAVAATRIHNVRTGGATNFSSQIGDRIIIEIGLHGVTPAAELTQMRIGDPAIADFALTEGLTTDLCPWVELSRTVALGAITQTKTIDSISIIKKLGNDISPPITLGSDSKVKKLGNDNALDSISYIKKLDNNQTINSISYIKKFDNDQLIQNILYVKKLDNDQIIYSDSVILVKTTNTKTIDSITNIKKLDNDQIINNLLYIKKLNNNQLINGISYAKKLDNDTILNSSSYIKKLDNEGVVDSLLYVKKLDNDKDLNSVLFIKKLDNDKSIDSDSYIIVSSQTQETTIQSDNQIKKLGNDKVLGSDSNVKKSDNDKTLDSDSKTKKLDNDQFINSDFYIKKSSIEVVLDSLSYIKKNQSNQDINSLLFIKKLDNDKMIDSDLIITIVITKNGIDSDSIIKKLDDDISIQSDSVISVISPVGTETRVGSGKLGTGRLGSVAYPYFTLSYSYITQETIDSDSQIILGAYAPIISDSYIKISGNDKTITNDCYVKKLGNDKTIQSISYIKSAINIYIDSWSVVDRTPTQHIDSDSYIKHTVIWISGGLCYVKVLDNTVPDIFSNSHILVAYQQDITSYSHIKASPSVNTYSDSYVKQTTQYITCDSVIIPRHFEQRKINSFSIIALSCCASLATDTFNEIIEMEQFKIPITIRVYKHDHKNLTGDFMRD